MSDTTFPLAFNRLHLLQLILLDFSMLSGPICIFSHVHYLFGSLRARMCNVCGTEELKWFGSVPFKICGNFSH